MLDKDSLKPVLESLIFAADSAISLEKLSGILEGEEKAIIKEALDELVEDYRARAGGFLIEEVGGGFQFRTNPEFAPWLRKFFKIGLQKISKAAMESLAVIAYKQPVTRGEIEAVRGVDSGGVLATLMEKRFIKIVGRKEVPGRPVVYGTTKEFLETFDLKDLSCLPTLKDIQKVEEEYAQTEGQGTAETAVEDRVQGAEKASGGLEDEVQESVQDGTAGVPEGEDIQASAEDGHGDGWEETDPEEMGSDGREEGSEDREADRGASGETEGDSIEPDLEERDREGDPDSETEDGASQPESGEEGSEDGASGEAGEVDSENGAAGEESGEEGPEDGEADRGAPGETEGDSLEPDLEERDREGDPDSETEDGVSERPGSEEDSRDEDTDPETEGKV
jgi:segregation and condensation protein B